MWPGERIRLGVGIRAALPLVLPLFAVGISFGVLAQPVMGSLAPIVMSTIVFAGAAQFAALSILATAGGAGAAVAAGLLLNLRYLPMGLAAGRSFTGGAVSRAAKGQAVVDASWALASRGDGSFDQDVLLGATIPQACAWVSGTVVGVFAGSALSDPARFGLDAIIPAFYLALLVGELRTTSSRMAAALGGLIALALLTVTPPGVPIIAASGAALLGFIRR